jgi:hypothetical protein
MVTSLWMVVMAPPFVDRGLFSQDHDGSTDSSVCRQLDPQTRRVRRRNVRRALLGALVVALAGCGGIADERAPRDEFREAVVGPGIAVEVPSGWNARILLGAEGRPVLHAANFALPSNDSDTGEVAQETIGSAGQLYINVRDLGPGESDAALPVGFDSPDFGPPPPAAGSRCCFITVASRDVAASGRVYRIAVVSGSDAPPSEAAVAEGNAVLSTLALEPYEPHPPTPASSNEHLAGYGIDLALAPGWHGRIAECLTLDTATFDLSGVDLTASFPGGPDDIAMRLIEHGGSDAPFVTARLPPELVPTEFVAPDGEQVPALTSRSFVVGGRQFVLLVLAGSLPPSPAAVAEANEILATLRVEPGDFYPGQVDAATFAAAPGWHTGTSGPAEVEPGGTQTTSWASTVPYGDGPYDFPPHETLAALSPDDIAIVAWLSRGRGSCSELAPGRPPFDLADAQEGSFEGVPPERATYRIAAHLSGFDVTLWIFFGRAEPSDEQLDRAQAELEHLRLPDWESPG